MVGVPPKLRERVWQLLVTYYRSCHPGQVPSGSYLSFIDKRDYERLHQQDTEYEPIICADIGNIIIIIVFNCL